MNEAAKHIFSLRDVAVALIREAGLHEGLWTLSVNFGVTPANFGATPSEAKPSVMVTLNYLELVPSTENKMVLITVDAAEVNPARKGLTTLN